MIEYSQVGLDELEEKLFRYSKEGNFKKGLECGKKSMEIAKRIYSPNHGRIGACHNNIAFFQHKLGNYSEAVSNYLSAIENTENWCGPESPELCMTLDNLGKLYKELGRYEEAEPQHLRAIKLLKMEYGPLHPNMPQYLNNLGDLYSVQGRLREAEIYFKSSINLWKELKGPAAPEITTPMFNLGEIYRILGKYSEAEKYICHSLEIKQQAVPPGHHTLASFYNSLGNLFYDKGEYNKSLDYHNEAVEIYSRVYGENHPLTARSFNNIGMTLKTLGRLEQAEAMYLKAVKLWESIYEGDHPDIAATMNNLALLYEQIRDFERAEHYYHRALGIRLNILGPDNINVAISYNNLANILLKKEDYEQAKELCQKALIILERIVGPDGPKLVYTYNTLASICNRQGNYNQAEEYYKKTTAIYEKAGNPDPYGLATVWNNLGKLYQDQNNYTKAEECINRAIGIRKSYLSDKHPDNIDPLLNLAALHMIRKDYHGALILFKKILSIQESYIDTVFSFADEEQKLQFIENLSTAYLVCLSAIHSHMAKKDANTLGFGFEMVIRRKGVVLDAEARTLKILQSQLTGTANGAWKNRSAKLSQLARLILANPSENNKKMAADKKKIEKIREDIKEIDRSLRESSSPPAQVLSPVNVALPDVIKALPENTAFLEFVKIRDFDFIDFKAPWGIIRYIVFILKKDGSVKMIDLGGADEIEQTIIETHRQIHIPLHDTGRLLRRLYTQIWLPLEKYLQNISRVIICPDSLLTLVPFAALTDNTGRNLVERFTITHVTSAGEIIPPAKKYTAGEEPSVFVANPDYDFLKDKPSSKNKSAPKARQIKFKRFKGISTEADEILPLLPGDKNRKKVLEKTGATKAAVLGLRNPRILHLATHGFFGLGRSDSNTPLETGLSKRTWSLTQSGLALTGANHSDLVSGNTEGLLTALEVTGMELSSTELVVLSACNTGIGEFLSGEGVFGLRRAFAIAGTRNLVMSLWSVSDEYTLRQMKIFYKNLRHMPPAEALRQAQLKIMTELKKTKERYAFPAIWAPFIIQGGQALTDMIFEDKESE
jgi:CHAT domain-containing protein/Flp pilus assembly protein TadD